MKPAMMYPLATQSPLQLPQACTCPVGPHAGEMQVTIHNYHSTSVSMHISGGCAPRFNQIVTLPTWATVPPSDLIHCSLSTSWVPGPGVDFGDTAVNTMSPPMLALRNWQYPCPPSRTSLCDTNSCLARAWKANTSSKGRWARSHLRNK